MTASRVGPVLDQVAGPIASFSGDGVYDRDDVYEAVAERHPEAAVIGAATHDRRAEGDREHRADAA